MGARHVVGVAEMKVSNQPNDVLVTHALGSCLGIAVHDSVARVGGIFHVMLPTASVNPGKANENPFMFVDTGTPLFFKQRNRVDRQDASVPFRPLETLVCSALFCEFC